MNVPIHDSIEQPTVELEVLTPEESAVVEVSLQQENVAPDIEATLPAIKVDMPVAQKLLP